MSDIKSEIIKNVKSINDTISIEEERLKVLKNVNDIVDTFTTQIVKLTEKQDQIEERVEEIFDMLSQIEEELVESFGEDIEEECPYCGELIPMNLMFPDGNVSEFECPKCHNTIELEFMMENNCACGCDNCHINKSKDTCCSCDDCEKQEENHEHDEG